MEKIEPWEQILINTHRQDCIDLLKARDYYFDKARLINRLKMYTMLIPLVLLCISYLPLWEGQLWKGIQDYRDIIVGVISISVFFLNFYQQNKIEELLDKSNTLREEYDERVYELEPNRIAKCGEKINEWVKKSRYVKDNPKYEVWYSEIFGENKWDNIICCQMDNVLYTYIAYQVTRKIMYFYLVLLSFATVFSVFGLFTKNMINDGVLFIISVFSIFQFVVDSIEGTRDQINEIEQVKENLKEYAKSRNQDEHKKELLVRCLQDYIISYRKNSIFIRGWVRRKYLKDEGNDYYKALDEIKDLFMPKDQAHVIEKTKDIPLLECPKESDEVQERLESAAQVKKVNLEDVQRHLLEMLKDVKMAWDASEKKIQYTLDGGSLLGAQRENGKMLFWDDDVDLIIPYSQIDIAKKQILEKLGNKYEIQDFENEEYYSPRLSNFRIREKNSVSRTTEKDSPLYRRYEKRGVFIDVYAYTPIVCNPVIDSFYRIIWLYHLNKKIKKIEDRIIFGEKEVDKKNSKGKSEKKFIHLKKKYLHRVKKYCENGNSKKYVSYTPNYIADYKKSGPYILYQDIRILDSEDEHIIFENMYFPKSANVPGVLEATYGEKWNISPVKTKEELMNSSKTKMIYSNNSYRVSSLKHLNNVTLF